MERTSPLRSIGESLKQNRRGLFRLWLVFAGIDLFSLLLGFAIFLIVFGIQLAGRRILVYWAPARSWLFKAFGLTLSELARSNAPSGYKIFVNLLHFIITFVYITLGIYMVKLGIDLLAKDGFLAQNFIYLIFSGNNQKENGFILLCFVICS